MEQITSKALRKYVNINHPEIPVKDMLDVMYLFYEQIKIDKLWTWLPLKREA